MIAGPPGRRCIRETQRRQIQFIDEHIDDPHRTVLSHIIVHAIRQEKLLPPIAPLDETPHHRPPKSGLNDSTSPRFHTASVVCSRTALSANLLEADITR